MGIHQYYKRLSDMEKLIRLPGKFKYFEHNVAAHSFKVTKIAQYLGTVEEYNGNVIDWKSLYEKALNHDFAEVFTGDIKTPVKYASRELKMLFSQVEEEMVENFIKEEIPEQYRDIYRQRLQEGKDDSLEGQILAVADKIDLLYETFGEIQKRNPEPLFFEIYEMSLETIMQFDHLASVHDFIDNVIPEMLTENFIPRTELRETTMTILNKRNR
ncbi:HD domain-containing protein [Staphylococcus warneri]|jgi:putative hydrolase of HD superfamily|uniref:HD domain-containing protein n=1 Tax=Staphylococcus warneri TaxID=1292 RepID=A0A2T4PZG0_STAWA|nr:MULTISPECIES: YfbR-like 5'-deoxynucleotidase [Staphylococcus]MBE9428828.1 HD domain-containing protein [Staphylococcus epidermidis]MBY6180560.1 HD domain-containing protein [Staphylococcaceae bacterium DP2N0-1]AXV42955.1 putative HD-family metal-dependent phosphohydrolase [Staphylococcus sp. M0911]EEQ80481.1 HD domain protein [Staphylococcus warneri L37603]MBO0376927.1 HD domain-containing protein [Staphylococcus warneri]